MVYDIKLTAKAVKAAKRVDDQDTEYRVVGKPHLRIVVCKTQVSLRVKTNVRNRRKCKTLGIFPFMTLATFERLGDEFYEKELHSKHPQFRDVTLDQFFYEVHLPIAKKTIRTWKGVEALYVNHIQEALGHCALENIQSLDVQQVLNGSASDGSDATFNRVRAVVHRSFTLAVNFGLLDRNPCKAIPARKEDNVVERVMCSAEVTGFIRACLSQSASLQHLSLLLALLVGGRIGNIISIEKEAIAPDLTHVIFKKTKSGKHQLVPLSEQARWVVQRALSLSDEGSPYLFPSSRTRTGFIAYPRNAFQRICAEAGIAVTGGKHPITPGFPSEPLTIHCLRKTFSSAVLEYTKDLHCSSTLLGHSDIKVTQRYAFTSQARLAEAVNGASQLMACDVPNFPRMASGSEKASCLIAPS